MYYLCDKIIKVNRKMCSSRLLRYFFMMARRYGNHIYVLVIFLFLTIGLIYSFYLGNQLKFPDERLYLAIAKNIAGGKGYSFDGVEPTAFLPPVYPLLLSIFIKLGFSIPLLRYLNFIFLSLSLVIIHSILRHEKAEIGIGPVSLLMGAYGVLFYTAGTFYPQTLFSLVLIMMVRVAICIDFNWIKAVLFGALSAMIVLVHGSGVFVPPVIGLWVLSRSHERRKIVTRLGLSVVIAMLFISLWSFRNYSAFHRIIPLTTHGGDTLYIGNNPHTCLSAWYDYVNDDFYKQVSKLPEPDQNSYYVKRTLDFWKNQPIKAARLYLFKFVNYFNFKNNLCVTREFNTWRSVIMFITYYPLVLCLILRLLYMRRFPLEDIEWLLLSLYTASALFYALFLPRIRFRLPYDLLLITSIGFMSSLIARNCHLLGRINNENQVHDNDIFTCKKQISVEN